MHLPKAPQLPWHNDFPLSVDEVARIVAGDIEEFAGCRASVLGEGWDFTTFLVDERIVFRFPKRRQCVRPLKREIESLARLRPLIASCGIAIPDYRHVVERSNAFPLAYGGYPLLPGRPLVEVAAAAIDAIALADSIGRLVGAIRANPPTRAPRPAPDDFSPADILEELDDATPALPAKVATACRAMIARYAPAQRIARAFSHGDLGVEHVLIDDGGRAVALIDWGDAGFAHVALDFVGLWAWGGDEIAARAIAAAGVRLSADEWRRMRFTGICYSIGTVYYGYKDGHEAFCESGLQWLSRAFAHGQIEDPSRPDG